MSASSNSSGDTVVDLQKRSVNDKVERKKRNANNGLTTGALRIQFARCASGTSWLFALRERNQEVIF